MAAHATPDDLADWLGGWVPPDLDASRLLERASRLVDWHVFARYATTIDQATGDKVPIDQWVRDGLRDATCAQVEFWAAVGEGHDIEGVRGEVSAPGASFRLPDTLAPRAARELALSGLAGIAVV